MLRTIRLVLGSTAIILGATLVGIALPARRASAVPVIPCDATPIPQVSNSAPQAEADFAVPTCTPLRIVRTATPTFTATVPATKTSEPTVAPTDTPVPPSSTATNPAERRRRQRRLATEHRRRSSLDVRYGRAGTRRGRAAVRRRLMLARAGGAPEAVAGA